MSWRGVKGKEALFQAAWYPGSNSRAGGRLFVSCRAAALYPVGVGGGHAVGPACICGIWKVLSTYYVFCLFVLGDGTEIKRSAMRAPVCFVFTFACLRASCYLHVFVFT